MPVLAAAESASYSVCLGMTVRGTSHLQVCLHDLLQNSYLFKLLFRLLTFMYKIGKNIHQHFSILKEWALSCSSS